MERETFMGHYCRICQRTIANERFSGRGHRDHICRDCQRMPRAKRDAIERLDELEGFLRQSNISDKNVARLKVLRQHPDEGVRAGAELVFALAGVCRHRRRRLPLVVRRHWPLFRELLEAFGGDWCYDYIMSYHGGVDWLYEAVTRAEIELTGKPAEDELADAQLELPWGMLDFDSEDRPWPTEPPPGEMEEDVPF